MHECNGLLTREYLENQLVVALGGRIAEEIIFGHNSVTTGASEDIQRVYEIAHMMVTRYGFNDDLGPIAWIGSNRFDLTYSEGTAKEIDDAVKELAHKAYERGRGILTQYKDALNALADILVEKETMSGDEVADLLKNM